MKIGLLDIDGHNFPNLALMKISAYHKEQGDSVEWVNHFNYYDRVYKSKVFTFTSNNEFVINADEIISGGTGYNPLIKLPEHIHKFKADYSLYPKYKEAYGFITRGCPNKCSWCIVPQKEGGIKADSDIEEILQDRKSAILMDNNILASDFGLSQIEKIIRLNVKVDFNQGLDVRIVAGNKDIAELLTRVKWIRYLRIACDTKAQIPYIEIALKYLAEFGFKSYRVFSYLLVKDITDAYERAMFLKQYNISVFAQPYRDFTTNKEPTREQKNFARWVNHKAIFNSVEFEKYEI